MLLSDVLVSKPKSGFLVFRFFSFSFLYFWVICKSVFLSSFTDATSSGEAEIYQRSLRTITSGLVGLRNCLHEQQEGATNMMPPAFVCSNYFQGKSFMCGHWVWAEKKLWSGFLNCPLAFLHFLPNCLVGGIISGFSNFWRAWFTVHFENRQIYTKNWRKMKKSLVQLAL